MQAEFDQTTNRFTFSDQGITGVIIESAASWLRYKFGDGRLRNAPVTSLGSSIREEQIKDAQGLGSQRVLQCPPNPDGIQLTYRIFSYAQYPFLLLQLSLSNLGREPVYLQDLCLFEASPSNGGRVHLSDSNMGYRFFKVGWHGWDYTGWRSSSDRNKLTWMDRLTSLS